MKAGEWLRIAPLIHQTAISMLAIPILDSNPFSAPGPSPVPAYISYCGLISAIQIVSVNCLPSNENKAGHC